MIIRVAKIEYHQSEKHKFYIFINGQEYDVGLHHDEEEAICEAFKIKREENVLCLD